MIRYKILNFIRKVLRIPDHTPHIEMKQTKVELVRSVYRIPSYEYPLMTKDQIEYTVKMGLMDELTKHGFVKIEEKALDGRFIEITATLKVIQP